MKKSFALEPCGPLRLTVNYPGNLANAQVLLDGQQIMAFASKEDFLRGTTTKLSDGSMLTARFGPIAGVGFLKGLAIFKGVHLIRNGAPIHGSAADPIPKWAWIFMIACALIPIVTLGGGLPALIGFFGVVGTLTVSRFSRLSTALRAGVCAMITIACWGLLGLLITMIYAGKTVYQAQQVHAKTNPNLTPTDNLINKIGVTYYKHGYLQSNIDQIKDSLYDHCDQMQQQQCTDYLNDELVKAQNAPDQP